MYASEGFRLRWFFVQIIAVLVLWTSPLRAEPNVGDPAVVACPKSHRTLCVVTLRNGGILVGSVVEIWAGERLILLLSTDERREIHWAEIAKAVPAQDPPLSLERKDDPSDSAADGTGAVIANVTVDGMQKGMSIQSLTKDDGWVPKCDWPCGSLRFSLQGTFRVSQPDGLSEHFELPLAPRIKLMVKPGVKTHRNAGIALLTIGATAVSAGLFTLFGTFLDNSPPQPSYSGKQSQDPRTPGFAAGGVLMVVGVAVLGVGIHYTRNGMLTVTSQPE